MPVRVMIPTPLRPFVGGAPSVDVSGATVGEAIQDLVARHEGVRKHILDGDGKLRSFVNVYVNDENVRHIAKMETPLRDHDVISIVPSVAGGRSWRA